MLSTLEHALRYWPLVAVLPVCLTLHEWAHALAADASGDPTPRLAGRVSLNPVRHLDLLGSVVLPLTAFLVSGGTLLFGWAKPVSFEPSAFRKPRMGLALTAVAGPAANLVTGSAAAVIYGMTHSFSIANQLLFAFAAVSLTMFALNLLIPVPPLDGSLVLAAMLPMRAANWYLQHGVWGLAGLAAGCLGGFVFGADMMGSFLDATGFRLLEVLAGV
jgi:Zn-dependent protease